MHKYLSQLFLNEISLNQIPLIEKEKIEWAYQVGSHFHTNYQAISEKLIKFSFFGQMISGTPDLIFIGNNDLFVWDFKTGLRQEDNEDSYWFQVMTYAYAYADVLKFPDDKTIEMSLVYLDQKNVISKKMPLKEITQVLLNYWMKTESLSQINTHHCSRCEFSQICQKSKKS